MLAWLYTAGGNGSEMVMANLYQSEHGRSDHI
jgi:hypothetical protein